MGHHPLTTEQLEYAIRKGDLEEVKRLLEKGVDPNGSIDEDDHTVMDVLMGEHQKLLSDFKVSCNRGDMEDDDLMECFEKNNSVVMEMFKLLRNYGAKCSAWDPTRDQLHM
eukprot:CAMPEP_0180467954 /NCGR_PEP_ID=MMETSP1036_2-20121128/27269_1 /TAXON_ID=632150 /ORGANISM="Azadinium spinosum, Strain 3D9" /LENGTH=110 /DNA_ID=CAMNT_0022474939 /DNA_START=110 /DNA_END=442 /DNA_ORIENTATION=+